MRYRHLFIAVLICSPVSTCVAAAEPSDGGTVWIYRDGRFSWPGDYSYQATIDYKDKTGKPDAETYDIAVTLTGQWGAWQPYATHDNFDRTGRKNLIFKLKPTKGLAFSCQFLKVGDKPMRVSASDSGQLSVDISNYGPKPSPGVWGSYSIPLDVVVKDAGIVQQAFYKFAIQDQSGIGDDVYYLADVGVQ